MAAPNSGLGAATRRHQRMLFPIEETHPNERVNNEQKQTSKICHKNLKYKLVGMSKNIQKFVHFCKKIYFKNA